MRGKPNIVLILADDQGWQEAGFAGSDFFETPVLDRLAGEGIVFPQAYSPMPNCAPSRACLISGQYSPRHRVFAVGTTQGGPSELMRLSPVPSVGGLPPNDFSVAKAMKAAGYATGMFGKWHLDGAGGSTPEEQGFDVVKVSGHVWGQESPEDPKGVFSISSAACEFIEANRDRPFFLYLPHYAIHTPAGPPRDQGEVPEEASRQAPQQRGPCRLRGRPGCQRRARPRETQRARTQKKTPSLFTLRTMAGPANPKSHCAERRGVF